MLAPTYKAISEGIPALYRAAHCCPDPSSMPHLPSFGFGPTSHFNNLFYDNPFLYRVFSEKSISPLMDKGFVAGHYSTGAIPSDLAGIRISYMDVANRIGQWRIPDSKLISTTFSFSYAVFEAYRRHFGKRDNGEKDVRIAVICSSRVSAHSVTGLEMLIVSKPDSIGRRGTSNRRNQKLQRLTNAESEVLVKGQIPLDAVEACVTMTELLDLLPGFWINVLMSFFKNKRRPGSIFRRADLLLQAAFKACTISVCEDGEEMGVDLGIGILKLQYVSVIIRLIPAQISNPFLSRIFESMMSHTKPTKIS